MLPDRFLCRGGFGGAQDCYSFEARISIYALLMPYNVSFPRYSTSMEMNIVYLLQHIISTCDGYLECVVCVLLCGMFMCSV